MFVFEGDAIGDKGAWGRADADVYHGGDFPKFDEDAHALGEEDHPAFWTLLVIKEYAGRGPVAYWYFRCCRVSIRRSLLA